MDSQRPTNRSRRSRWQGGLVLGGAALLVTFACSSSDDERERASKLAGGCTINSDCDKNLICAFERCHQACKEDRDCERDLRCVKTQTEVFVCQLDDETVCTANEDCPGQQICGVDEECRDPCGSDAECIFDQVCDPSGSCASTAPGKDHLDAKGLLIAAEAPGSGGAGNGAAGMPDEPSGGEEADPGRGGSSSASGSGNEAVGGNGASAGSSGNTGEGGAPNFAPADYSEEPGAAEVVPNDFREDAIPITQGVNVYLAPKAGAGLPNNQDADWFSFVVPDDGRAHIITVHIDQQTTLSTNVHIYAGADESAIGNDYLQKGTTRSLYVTVGSGTTTLFNFSNYLISGSHGMAFITFEDTPEDDDHEPNNTFGSATPLELGQTYFGQALNPFVAENDRPHDDWFSVYLDVGTYQFAPLTVPADGGLRFIRRAPTGVETVMGSPMYGSIPASPYQFTVSKAGTYYFNVTVNPSAPSGHFISAYAYNEEPAYLSQQYSFSVSAIQ